MSDTIAPSPTDDPLVPSRPVLNRYQIVDRTLDRWIADPKLDFPQPIYINRRRYFRLRELEAWERGRARAGKAA